MNDIFYNNFVNAINPLRIEVYKTDSIATDGAMARYIRNIELCKSFYTSLHCFEIALRNAVDKVLINEVGSGNDWFDTITFDTESTRKINEAKDKIIKKGKTITHDRLVSELSLGFWTSFFTKKYNMFAFQSKIVKKGLCNCPRSERAIDNIQKKFENIRVLRNRVFHYERIIHYTDLDTQHQQILECIKWMSLELYEFAENIDTYKDVKSTKEYKDFLQDKFN